MDFNLIDYGILGVLILFFLLGMYKGFLHCILSVGAYLVSWLAGMLLMPLGADIIKSSEKLYEMMLYYTEGSEYVANIPEVGVEAARMNISALSADQINDYITRAAVPYPMGKEIAKNIANEAFAAQNVTTLGDYFNQTIVCVFINILVFLVIFLLARAVLGFFIGGMDYAWQLPQLRTADWAVGAALGILRGVLALFLIFMLLPIVLTVLGQFDLITDLVKNSEFAQFFYYSNFLLSMIPGV
jgi:uncharacterized membrane protein required for colicin V production